eukprot:3197976-Rhodomonas_salina.1
MDICRLLSAYTIPGTTIWRALLGSLCHPRGIAGTGISCTLYHTRYQSAVADSERYMPTYALCDPR